MTGKSLFAVHAPVDAEVDLDLLVAISSLECPNRGNEIPLDSPLPFYSELPAAFFFGSQNFWAAVYIGMDEPSRAQSRSSLLGRCQGPPALFFGLVPHRSLSIGPHCAPVCFTARSSACGAQKSAWEEKHAPCRQRRVSESGPVHRPHKRGASYPSQPQRIRSKPFNL